VDEARLALALDAGQMGTWDWNLASGAISWAGHHARVMGVAAEEFDGRYQSFARRVHPDDLPGVEAAVARARDAGVTYDHEYRVVWPDGSVHWVAGRGRFFYDSQGRPRRMTGVIHDITGRREADERLRAANAERDRLLERLQLVLERMPIGCVMSALDFTISYWNPAAERIFGYPAATMVGRSPYGTIVDAASSSRLEGLRQRLAAGDLSAHSVNENRTADGRTIVCEWHNTPLFGRDGAVAGYLAMVQDVTERWRREAEIARLHADLERRVVEHTDELAARNRELEIFTYSVSHDLKAPLRGIDGYSRLLQEDYGPLLDEDGRAFVAAIRGAAAQMGALIDDLLAYSRLERRALQRRPVAVRELAQAVCAEFAAEVRARDVELSVELPDGEALAEPEALAQALRNLVDNALKFSRNVERPQIAVGGAREPGRWLIWVRDNGPGIAPDYHERIFEIFQRLERAEEYPGTGVGLAIVRRAAERMGGRAWVESAPGRGATFFLSIPDPAEEGR
jgi:PAS domain S-box-containing protein